MWQYYQFTYCKEIPEHTVISIADHKEAKQSVGDVNVKDKVKRILRLGQLVNEVLDGVSGWMSVRRTIVPITVEVNAFGNIL